MSLPADDAMKESVSRSFATSSGYLVKQSEEVIRILRKENFNLKLKMFLMEDGNGRPSKAPEGSEVGDNDFLDLFVENMAMKNELNELRSLLKVALIEIQTFEWSKVKSDERCRKMIEQRAQSIALLKVNNETRNEVFPIKASAELSDEIEEEPTSQVCSAEGCEREAFGKSFEASGGSFESFSAKLHMPSTQRCKSCSHITRNIHKNIFFHHNRLKSQNSLNH